MIRLRCALWERNIFQAFLIWGCTLSTRFIITFTNTASTFYLGLWSLLSCQADAQFHPFLGQSHGLLTTLPQNKPRVGGDVVVESKICRPQKNQRNWLTKYWPVDSDFAFVLRARTSRTDTKHWDFLYERHSVTICVITFQLQSITHSHWLRTETLKRNHPWLAKQQRVCACVSWTFLLYTSNYQQKA